MLSIIPHCTTLKKILIKIFLIYFCVSDEKNLNLLFLFQKKDTETNEEAWNSFSDTVAGLMHLFTEKTDDQCPYNKCNQQFQ